MCSLFSEIPTSAYGSSTRSVRLAGHVTSIRLEAAFWSILETIAAEQGASLGKFLTTLHDEVLAFGGESANFASLLRCACLTYVSAVQNNASLREAMIAEARRDMHLSA